MCTLVFCVLEDDDAVLKVYVAVANQANRAGAISAIEKKIDDDPGAILGEAAFFQVGFLQKFCQFILKKEQEGKPYNVAKMAGVNKFLRIYYARAMELYR